MLHTYLDSADRARVVPLLKTGLFAGVTTNQPIIVSGARFVAPFLARMDALGTPTVKEVLPMQVA